MVPTHAMTNEQNRAAQFFHTDSLAKHSFVPFLKLLCTALTDFDFDLTKLL